MNKLQSINGQVTKELREIINKQLLPLEADLGVTFDLGNARYSEDSVKFGFVVALEDALSKTEKALQEHLTFRREVGWLVSFDQDKIADLDNMKVSLVGYKPRATKRPFVVQNLKNGSEYVINDKLAEKLFGDNTIGKPLREDKDDE